MKYKKGIKKIVIGSAVLSFLALPFSTDALTLVTADDIKCTYTDEYKEYLKLSDEEKAKVIVPTMCKELYTKVGTNAITLPTKYDLRDVDGKSYVTSVKNQMNTGTCWAHAMASSIESNYLLNGGSEINVSELYMAYKTSYSLSDDYLTPLGQREYGGSFGYSLVAYDAVSGGGTVYNSISLVGNKKFVTESDTDPSKSGLTITDSITDSSKGTQAQIELAGDYDVNELTFGTTDGLCSSDEIKEIKNLIMTQGTVSINTASANFQVKGYLAYLKPYLKDSEGNFDLETYTFAKEFLNSGYSSMADYINATYTDSTEKAAKTTIANRFASQVSSVDSSKVYSTLLYSYNADSSIYVDHAVSIVGWDDSLSADLFAYEVIDEDGNSTTYKPSSNGGWIIKNSYGTEYGDNGYYYISYEDVNTCYTYISFDGVEESKNENVSTNENMGRLLPADLNTDYLYLANKFTKSDTSKLEYIDNISILALESGLYYKLVYSPTLSVSDGTLLSAGTTDHAGLNNITFDKQVVDDTYYIILMMEGEPDGDGDGYSYYPLSAFALDDSTEEHSITVATTYNLPTKKTTQYAIGESYYSPDGLNWADSINEGLQISNTQSLNFESYVYAYGKTTDFNFKIDSDNVTKNVTTVDKETTIEYPFIIDNMEIQAIGLKVTNSKGTDVSDKITKTLSGSTIKLTIPENTLDADTYTVKFTYTDANGSYDLYDAFTLGAKIVKVSSITISGEHSVYANGRLVLTASVGPEDATNKELVWISSNERIATVDNGIVSGITEGTVTITALSVDGSDVTATYEVNVIGVPNEAIINVGSNTNNGITNPKTGATPVVITALVLAAGAAIVGVANKKKYFIKF